MKFLKFMPFDSLLDNNYIPVATWEETYEENICEFSADEKAGKCDTSNIFYGTNDENEPKFCARHFYQIVVSGDGVRNYKLFDKKK